jgi:hypothetical protein
MKRWGLRDASLSADTKANAGQKYSCYNLNPNVLYMMLAGVNFYILFQSQISFQPNNDNSLL